MQFAFLSVVLGVSVADFFLNGRFTAAGLVLLYTFLKVQAEYAASKFLRESLASSLRQEAQKEAALQWEAQGSDYIPVAPLRGKGPVPKDSSFSGFFQQLEEKTKRVFSPKKPEVTPAKEKQKQSIQEKMRKTPSEIKGRKGPTLEPLPFRHPNFRGSPHETLGISDEAKTRTILRAFRFWIKRFHPDLHGQSEKQARAITEARDRLLEARKNKSA